MSKAQKSLCMHCQYWHVQNEIHNYPDDCIKHLGECVEDLHRRLKKVERKTSIGEPSNTLGYREGRDMEASDIQ